MAHYDIPPEHPGLPGPDIDVTQTRVIGCESCQPVFVRSGPRYSYKHRAVRFGDYRDVVSLNGSEIYDVSEVMVGPGGWAFRISPPSPHQCRCSSGLPEWMTDQSDGYTVKIPQEAESHGQSKSPGATRT